MESSDAFSFLVSEGRRRKIGTRGGGRGKGGKGKGEKERERQ